MSPPGLSPVDGAAIGSVSVVIPTYNREKLLVETIDSVLPQLLQADQLMVVDDGSTDGTRDAVAAYGSRVQYFWQKNAFLAGARNTGMSLATAEFVLFLDSDDLLIAGSIDRLRSLLIANPQAVLAYGPADCFNSSGPCEVNVLNDPSPVRPSVRLAKMNFIRTSGCVMIRKSALLKAGQWDGKLRGVEDWDMWMRLSLLGEFVRTDQAVLRYRVHDSNMCADWDLMDGSHQQLVLKYSRLFSPLRQDADAWKVIRDLRSEALYRELKRAIKRVRNKRGSLTRVCRFGIAFFFTRQGVRHLTAFLLRRTVRLNSSALHSTKA